jgi:uncharacterized YigZ family protein
MLQHRVRSFFSSIFICGFSRYYFFQRLFRIEEKIAPFFLEADAFRVEKSDPGFIFGNQPQQPFFYGEIKYQRRILFQQPGKCVFIRRIIAIEGQTCCTLNDCRFRWPLFISSLYLRSMENPDFFLSPAAPANAEYKDRGSRFIAFSYPVESENEVKKYLEALKQAYPDATHHCYAYVLGKNRENQRSSDDGEPSNTAGKPILRQILSKELSNVLVVVVRYFGGVQLGVPGLIQAYGEVAKQVLELSGIVEKPVEKNVLIQYEYQDEGLAFRIIRQLEGSVVEIKKALKASVQFRIRLSREKELEELQRKYYQLEITYLQE